MDTFKQVSVLIAIPPSKQPFPADRTCVVGFDRHVKPLLETRPCEDMAACLRLYGSVVRKFERLPANLAGFPGAWVYPP
ncbi:hypothetical protein M3J09_002571 [Ascochyta lentis]